MFLKFHILTAWGESAPQNRRLLTILGEYFQNRLNYGHLKTKDLPYKPVYFSPGSERLEPDTKYSGLVGNMSAFNRLYISVSFFRLN